MGGDSNASFCIVAVFVDEILSGGKVFVFSSLERSRCEVHSYLLASNEV